MISVSFFALFLVGSLMLILGIFLLIYWIFNNREKVPQQKSKTLSSGIVMIGPIPIVFGDSKWFYIIPIAAIVTIFLILLLLGWLIQIWKRHVVNADIFRQDTFVLNVEGSSLHLVCHKKTLSVTCARREEEMNQIGPIIISSRI